VPLADGIVKQWREVFKQLETKMQQEGQQIVWALVDGFLLYWNDVRPIPNEYKFC
jgi:nicotinamide/nicotinate riboside kinase